MNDSEKLLEYRKKLTTQNITEIEILELMKLLKIDNTNEEKVDSSNNKTSEKKYSKSIPGRNILPQEQETNLFNQNGYSNVLFLSTFTLIMEVIFFGIALVLFK